MASKDELACTYAALILMDDDVPITIVSLLKAANVNVEPYWPGLFAKATAGLDLKTLVTNIGAGVGTGGGGGGGGAPAADAPAAAAPVVEKKVEEPEEESDDDMGIGLFGRCSSSKLDYDVTWSTLNLGPFNDLFQKLEGLGHLSEGLIAVGGLHIKTMKGETF
ncbi:Ribosomal protein L12 family [Trinorchestia longiramus]|nr:Ribosomal protein L12 family [Trinorchestia longiramus]